MMMVMLLLLQMKMSWGRRSCDWLLKGASRSTRTACNTRSITASRGSTTLICVCVRVRVRDVAVVAGSYDSTPIERSRFAVVTTCSHRCCCCCRRIGAGRRWLLLLLLISMMVVNMRITIISSSSRISCWRSINDAVVMR